MQGVAITFLKQSGFYLEFESSSMLIDPMNKTAGDRSGEIVYITHGHVDHTGGLETFMERNPEAILITNEQVARRYSQWANRIVIANPGESYTKEPFHMEFVECKHGIFRGVMNMGVIVRTGGQTFGHCGDSTTLAGFYDKHVDFMAVPVSGIIATKAKDVLRELRNFKEPPQYVIPMHWLFRKPEGLCKLLSKELPGVGCIVPSENEIVIG
ncbi:MAG: MBL fold metallo-hydrolase [Candidatus Hodarchaeota archaeon]